MQPPSPDDEAACAALLREGSKSFALAGRLLPRRVRRASTILYAFCRIADDAIDNGGGARAVAEIRERVRRAYEGRPHDHAVDRAFAWVVEENALPQELVDALVEGFAWDSEGRRYPELADLRAYAARVAGTVGAMMTVVMGERAPEVLARACDLGVAMQLTNIARDVGEDARMGRVYLPLSWLDRAGIDPDDLLARPRPSAPLGSVVERLLDHADELYARSRAGIGALPRDCRRAIRAASDVYGAIGQEIRRAGLDSVSRRAVVPTWRKVWLVARALFAPAGVGVADALPALSAPPLAETRFLVGSVRDGA